MHGGPSKKTQEKQLDISQEQADTAKQYQDLSKKSLAEMDTLTKPAVNFYSGVASTAEKGDYNGLIKAAGPEVGTVSTEFDAARKNILNTIPAGPGRDQALAELPVKQAGVQSGVLNQAFTDSLKNLTQIGAAYGGVGLNEGQLNLSGLQGSANTVAQLGGEQAQGKANTMGFLGSLAGAAGTAAGGGVFGHLG